MPLRFLFAAILVLTTLACGGEAEVNRDIERRIDLGDRMLVLNAPGGRVDLVGADTSEAALAFRKRALGRNARDADRVLEAVALDEAQDTALYQFIVTAPYEERIVVDVSGVVPQDAPLYLQTPDATVVLRHLVGSLTIEQARSIEIDYELPSGDRTLDLFASDTLIVRLPTGGEASCQREGEVLHVTISRLIYQTRLRLQTGPGGLLSVLAGGEQRCPAS